MSIGACQPSKELEGRTDFIPPLPSSLQNCAHVGKRRQAGRQGSELVKSRDW
jgi:hypothetical protein